jgi:CRP-like cAMP-binding protein
MVGAANCQRGARRQVNIDRARIILKGVGWLSRQPGTFQEQLLARITLRRYAAGEVVYRLGAPLGGVYGLVSGSVIVTTAAPASPPRLLHYAMPGSWIGEGCFISREPRRVGMQAATATCMAYLPLDAMDQLASQDPMSIQRFAQILILNMDILLQAFCDLQHPDEQRRVAATLCRIGGKDGIAIPLTQAELGLMANASRKQVNGALNRFEQSGWISKGYRSVTLRSFAQLQKFVRGPEDDE